MLRLYLMWMDIDDQTSPLGSRASKSLPLSLHINAPEVLLIIPGTFSLEMPPILDAAKKPPGLKSGWKASS
ncbi:hypothetical protein D3C73_1639280 [compost metagenome]